MSELKAISVVITPERPDTPNAMQLIAELEAILLPQYPPQSCHGYSVEKLIARGVAFFVVRSDDTPVGCAGVQLYGHEYGELKRMYVRPPFRGFGLGKRLVRYLEAYTLAHGVPLLRLETGIHQHEAVGLYKKMGFEEIGPFGDYQEDPVSLFFEKRLR